MTQQFSGKVALVTGGASGLGRVSAMALAKFFSDAAAFITGHSLVMDGGIVAE
jgi:NAD(P)-dependent dehydrogenase (short-subunit alcohol dehydrogenase family)